jgi:two-component system cell cycle sensor histidine kinase/response regulator CckA
MCLALTGSMSVVGAKATRAAAAFTPQLQQAHRMEALGRLAGGIAHDFNNLLTAISGYSELIAVRLPASDPMIEDVNEIRRAALSAGRLTRHLLALSTNQTVHAEVLDLNAIVSRTTGILRRLLGEDIAVTLALGADIRAIKADAGQIEQIVLNLAVNARDAMPDGGHLTVTTSMAGSCVRLTMADTGCGMSEETRSRVFEPFFTTKGAAGTGLGLATVHDIVKQNHGAIELTSVPGVGTTFSIDLPATFEALSPEVRPAKPATVADGSSRVLVVEDDPGVRRLIELALRRAGHDVVPVAGPRDALAALTGQPNFTLVLTDIVMPEMNGHDLAVEIRRIAPGLPIGFMSGFARDLAPQTAGELFLAKPFTVESLTTFVRQASSAAKGTP